MLFTFNRDSYNVVTINYVYNGTDVTTENFFDDGMVKVKFQVSLFSLYYFEASFSV